MAQRSPQQGGEGLSLQTLVIAALAAGCAAVLTSYLWPVSYTHLTLPTILRV